ncbi:MAG TPA: RlpA-like double-psi beta-barrel domain-containing protein [Acetobacteraceae bacterium]|nr:RlpA-like double-psi beta-barrel domain-containing protein [Acetobacteraceae bacterium]
MKRAIAAVFTLLVASCHRPPPAAPHYVLGSPYQAGGVWYYPSESYDGAETGLAIVYPSDHPDLTTDGEIFDQSALTAAHQTLQLPAIVRLTNLENGLQLVVRVNDRGPATPHRMVEVTNRVAVLLRFPSGTPVRARVEVLPAESHAAVDQLPGAPKLAIAAAPRGVVQQVDLSSPAAATPVQAPTTEAPREALPASVTIAGLPETVTQSAAYPGRLYIQLGTFQTYEYAAIQRSRVGGLGAAIDSTRNGRTQTHRVYIGPLDSVQQADNVLDQVLRSGVTDARIVVQ